MDVNVDRARTDVLRLGGRGLGLPDRLVRAGSPGCAPRPACRDRTPRTRSDASSSSIAAATSGSESARSRSYTTCVRLSPTYRLCSKRRRPGHAPRRCSGDDANRGMLSHPPSSRLCRTSPCFYVRGTNPDKQNGDGAAVGLHQVVQSYCTRPSGRAPPGSQIYHASAGPPPFSGPSFVADPDRPGRPGTTFSWYRLPVVSRGSGRRRRRRRRWPAGRRAGSR